MFALMQYVDFTANRLKEIEARVLSLTGATGYCFVHFSPVLLSVLSLLHFLGVHLVW